MPLDPQAYRPAADLLSLGDDFYDPVAAASFPETRLRFRNDRAADEIGLATLEDADWTAHFGRFTPLPGTLPQPLALRYHGHQFRQYNPDIGDGRGFTFAQMRDRTGRLMDLGTKGSGQTPWSRFGDGRLTLKGGVREVLASEMLEALGVPTSRSFSLIETGEALERNDEPSPTRGAVLVRLSHGHIRIGTFQRLGYLRDEEGLRRLVRYTLANLYGEPGDDPVRLLELVVARAATLAARYMAAGFVHGVLNSDNINVTGESFDYGPWRFLPHFDPDFTAAYFDETGLYSFGRQPEALFWNLARLADCLLVLAPQARLETALSNFGPALQEAFAEALFRRLGLAAAPRPETDRLVSAVWRFLAETRAPFERFFFDWYGGRASAGRAEAGPAAAQYRSEAFAPVRAALEPLAPAPGARLDHPYFAEAPCTLLIDEVEALWAPIAAADDWSLFEAKLEAVARMAEACGTVPASA